MHRYLGRVGTVRTIEDAVVDSVDFEEDEAVHVASHDEGPDQMRDTSSVRVSRTSAVWRDRLRRYRIEVDGLTVGCLFSGGMLEVPLAPGEHSVQVRIDWSGSPRLSFDLAPDRVASFECREAGSSLPTWKNLRQLFSRTKYVDLYPL